MSLTRLTFLLLLLLFLLLQFDSQEVLPLLLIQSSRFLLPPILLGFY